MRTWLLEQQMSFLKKMYRTPDASSVRITYGDLPNPRKPCCIFSICAVVIFVGGCCQIGGLVYEEDLVNGYAVWATDTMQDASIVHKDKGGSGAIEVVPNTVFAYGWNDDFILAKQHPEKSMKVDTTRTHWYIVEVASGKVHGPLSEGEFDKLRTELKVPADISFKTIK